MPSKTKPPERPGWTVVLVPTQAWETLEETLQMDAQSIAFDITLRASIERSLAQCAALPANNRQVQALKLLLEP